MDEREKMLERYKQNITQGMSEEDAYLEAYSSICSQTCEKNGVCENGDGSLD